MSSNEISRRDAIRAFGGALVAGAVMSPDLRMAVADPSKKEVHNIEVVDTHVHLVSSRLAWAVGETSKPSFPFDLLQQPGGAERLATLTENEFKSAGVTHALCMPTAVVSDNDPLGVQPTLVQAERMKGVKLHAIGVAHPERFDREHLSHVEAILKQGKVKGFKAYLGYLHYDPMNVGYRPYYRLAAKYNIPVIFHTGDTYSEKAKVKFAHPLQVDEIAVDFPDTKFVLAHFGNPWIMDAAQVLYKNKNVWADLSATVIGDTVAFAKMEKEGVLERAAKRLMEGIEYTEAPERFLFGSDWPLSPIANYCDFVKRLFPENEHVNVLGANAKKLFGL